MLLHLKTKKKRLLCHGERVASYLVREPHDRGKGKCKLAAGDSEKKKKRRKSPDSPL